MKLQVVKTDKGYVAISEQIPHQDHNMRTDDEGKWVISLYNSWIGTLSQEYRGLWRIRWKVSDSMGYLLSDPHSPENYRMIVATDTTFKLEGIPQFELESVSAGSIAIDAWNKIATPEDADIAPHYIDGYMNGYEAAQSKGCFTEEDVKKALVLKNMGYGEKYILDSLKQPKKLVAIEVETQKVPVISDKEYEELEKGTREYTDTKPFDIELVVPQNKSEQYPDGLLTIKQYFYE